MYIRIANEHIHRKHYSLLKIEVSPGKLISTKVKFFELMKSFATPLNKCAYRLRRGILLRGPCSQLEFHNSERHQSGHLLSREGVGELTVQYLKVAYDIEKQFHVVSQ